MDTDDVFLESLPADRCDFPGRFFMNEMVALGFSSDVSEPRRL